jgi:hypothetical protein
MSDRIRLPDPTPQPQPFFPPGSWVRLRSCQHGEAGRVIRCEAKRVIVDWPSLGFKGRHRPIALMLAVDAEGPSWLRTRRRVLGLGKPSDEAKEASNGHQS